MDTSTKRSPVFHLLSGASMRWQRQENSRFGGERGQLPEAPRYIFKYAIDTGPTTAPAALAHYDEERRQYVIDMYSTCTDYSGLDGDDDYDGQELHVDELADILRIDAPDPMAPGMHARIQEEVDRYLSARHGLDRGPDRAGDLVVSSEHKEGTRSYHLVHPLSTRAQRPGYLGLSVLWCGLKLSRRFSEAGYREVLGAAEGFLVLVDQRHRWAIATIEIYRLADDLRTALAQKPEATMTARGFLDHRRDQLIAEFFGSRDCVAGSGVNTNWDDEGDELVTQG